MVLRRGFELGVPNQLEADTYIFELETGKEVLNLVSSFQFIVLSFIVETVRALRAFPAAAAFAPC